MVALVVYLIQVVMALVNTMPAVVEELAIDTVLQVVAE
jgi:hypothetical protein